MYKISPTAKCLSSELKGHDVIEITFEWYYQMLEGVPPMVQHSDWFVCGEPYSHDPKTRKATYNHFLRYDGKYYAFAPCTPTTKQHLIEILANALDNS